MTEVCFFAGAIGALGGAIAVIALSVIPLPAAPPAPPAPPGADLVQIAELEGLERITPGTTYVFVSNHQSIYDTPVVFASLPYQIRIIAKASLARFPVLGWHLRRGGHLFVDRKRPDRAGILRRWRALRATGDETAAEKMLPDLLLAINAIASGLRTTG